MSRLREGDETAEEMRELRVLSVNKSAEGVLSLELQAVNGKTLPAWHPGAHIDLHLAQGIVRQYSLCGDPSNRHVWRIAILREQDSRGGSQFVHESICEGDTLSAVGPRNNFELADAPGYLFIAGGIGITPILPMIRKASRLRRPWRLVYGGRTRNSMAFVEELQQFSGGELSVIPEDEQGMLDLDDLLVDQIQDLDIGIYCCGPEPLISAVEQRCAHQSAGTLHVERFVPQTRTLEKDEFEVEIASTGQRFIVPSHVSLLEVLESNGYEVTNSCRAGICGTCLTKVTDGVPEHNDDVLSDEERETNELILPCVSRSKTDVLVLDL